MNPPKPRAIRILEGNRGKRPYNLHEPTARVGEPEMPSYLDKLARVEWKKLVPILREMRVLTHADGRNLANLCQSHSALVRAVREMRKLEKGGKSALLMQTPSGYVQQSPLLSIINIQIKIQTTIMREFGMSPSSRTRIKAEAEEGTDPILQALCG